MNFQNQTRYSLLYLYFIVPLAAVNQSSCVPYAFHYSQLASWGNASGQ